MNKNNTINKYNRNDGDWGLGIGDWGLGIGDWAQSPIPNPQSPESILILANNLNVEKNQNIIIKILLYFI